MITYIYQVIEYLIKNNIPDIKYFDFYFKQKKILDSTLLLEIKPIEFTGSIGGNKNQQAILELDFHYYIEILDSTDTRNTRKINALEKIKKVDKIFSKLSGLGTFNIDNYEIENSPYYLSNLYRTKLQVSTDDSSTKEFILTFTCNLDILDEDINYIDSKLSYHNETYIIE